MSRREHYLQFERQTGKRPAELDGPACPDSLLYLWDWWQQIRPRGGTGFGPASITFAEIDAFVRLLHIDIEPWEVEAIRRLDGAFLRVVMKREGRTG